MRSTVPFKPPIFISELAAENFFNFLHTNNNEQKKNIFAIGILENRGCSGNKYYIKPFDFDQIDEKLFDFFSYNKSSMQYKKYSACNDENEIVFAIDRFSLFKLIGSTIDFSDTDRLSKGFFFTNPNETGRCGCGESFSL